MSETIERGIAAIERIAINNEAFAFGKAGKDADGLDMQALYSVCLSDDERITARKWHHMGTEEISCPTLNEVNARRGYA